MFPGRPADADSSRSPPPQRSHPCWNRPDGRRPPAPTPLPGGAVQTNFADKNNVIVLSDVHIGTSAPTCGHQRPLHEPYLLAILDWVVANAASVDRLVLLGARSAQKMGADAGRPFRHPDGRQLLGQAPRPRADRRGPARIGCADGLRTGSVPQDGAELALQRQFEDLVLLLDYVAAQMGWSETAAITLPGGAKTTLKEVKSVYANLWDNWVAD